MNLAPGHRIAAAHAVRVPKPFASLAVRSEEDRHANAARAPYGWVHVLRTGFIGADDLAALAASGQARMQVSGFSDIDYAPVTLDELAAAAPAGRHLVDGIAAALQATGVIGDEPDAYRRSVAARIDYLASHGAGFHNDVSRHWTACLFWNLTLAAADVEFVMPHADLRLSLSPGDLIVFDPAMAHGLCRPQDEGQAVAESFGPGTSGSQVFLSGELALTDDQWAALDAPWLPVEAHQQRGALDLLIATFDERSGAVQRPRTLVNGMRAGPLPAETEGAPISGTASGRG